MAGGGEDLGIGDSVPGLESVGNLSDFHDDSDVTSGECHVEVVEGEIGAEIHSVRNHHASNSKFHGISISCVVKGFHGMKTTGSF
jgi:hypothetical protein